MADHLQNLGRSSRKNLDLVSQLIGLARWKDNFLHNRTNLVLTLSSKVVRVSKGRVSEVRKYSGLSVRKNTYVGDMVKIHKCVMRYTGESLLVDPYGTFHKPSREVRHLL